MGDRESIQSVIQIRDKTSKNGILTVDNFLLGLTLLLLTLFYKVVHLRKELVEETQPNIQDSIVDWKVKVNKENDIVLVVLVRRWLSLLINLFL